MKLITLSIMVLFSFSSIAKTVCNGVQPGKRGKLLPMVGTVAEVYDDGKAVLMLKGKMVFSTAVSAEEIEDVSEDLGLVSKVLAKARINYSRANLYRERSSNIGLVTFEDSYGVVLKAVIVPIFVEDGGVGFGADLDDNVRFFESGAVSMVCSSN